MANEPIRDIEYVKRNGQALKLDMYLPASFDAPCPVVVWIHGGAWSGGSKDLFPDPWFIDSGIAIAAIDYRLSGVSVFPAAIEDAQTAVCWLRAHAAEYKLNPDRIGAWGGSAGAHLAALLGASAGIREWKVPEELADQPRGIQAVCDVNGPSLLTRLAEPAMKTKYATMYEIASQFLGGPVEEKQALAEEASPVKYAHAGCPQFLIFHGTTDVIVPFSDGVLLRKALEAAGVKTEFHAMKGSGHSYSKEHIKEMNDRILDFFVRVLKS